MLIIQKLHFCHWQLMILKCEMQASRCQQSAPDKDGIIAILKHPAIYFNEAKNILQTIMERSFCALFWWTFSFYEVFLRVVHPYLSRPTLTSTFQLYHGPIMLKSLFCRAKAAQHSSARVGKTCDPHPHIEHISEILGKAILYRTRDTSLQAEKKGFCVTLGQFCAVCSVCV